MYASTGDSSVACNMFAYCLDNPVNRVDSDGKLPLPNWAKLLIGAVVIVGLAVATVYTGGAAAAICGAAFYGAVAGAATGTIIGGISGGISGGWSGVTDGMCTGFLSGSLSGGLSYGATAAVNIATGTTAVTGSAHGSALHKLATNVEVGKMTVSGNYSEIGINKSLKTMRLNGTSRPDIIGIANGKDNVLVEVVSPKQSVNYISNKMSDMLATNPGTVGSIITWVRNMYR